MADALYYKHSGRFEPGGLLVSTVVATLVSLALAFAYAYLILYIPLAGYVSILLTGGFGFGMGLTIGFCLRWQKVRNVEVAALVAIVVALLALYVSWGVWVHALLRRNDVITVGLLTVLLKPLALWAVIGNINAVGAWTIKSFTPTGAVLWLFWLVEAAIIVGLSVFVGYSTVGEHPFCERCQAWCERANNVLRLAAQTPTYLKRKLEGRDFAFIEKLGLPRPDAAEWFQMDIDSCPGCSMTHVMTVKHVTVSVDKQGKQSEKSTAVVDGLLISPSENQMLRGLATKLAAPPVQPPG